MSHSPASITDQTYLLVEDAADDAIWSDRLARLLEDPEAEAQLIVGALGVSR